MKALVRKELREHWALAALLFCGLSGAMLLSVNRLLHDSGFRVLTVGSFSKITLLGFGACALVLGGAQVLFERREGCLPFLVHRPLSYYQVFGGKVLAGILLYLFASALPLTLVALWLAWPGNVAAPFFPGYLLPPLVDLAVGLVWYFAAMIVVLRPLSWWGWRLLPLGFPLAAVLLVRNATTLGPALAAALLANAVLAVAAFGCFRSLGANPLRGAFVKCALGATLLAGLFFAGSLVALAIPSAWLRPTPVPTQGPPTYDLYVLDLEGTVLRATYRNEGDLVALARLDGTAVELRPGLQAPETLWADHLWNVDSPSFPSTPGRRIRDAEQRVRSLFDRIVLPKERWYYAQDCRCFLGYDRVTARRIGALGPSGLATGLGWPLEGFEGEVFDWSPEERLLVVSPRSIYRIDTRNRLVEQLPVLDSGDRVRAARQVHHAAGPPGLVVVTQRSVLLLSPLGEVVARLPSSLDRMKELAIARTKNAPTAILLQTPAGTGDILVREYEFGGKLVRTQQYPARDKRTVSSVPQRTNPREFFLAGPLVGPVAGGLALVLLGPAKQSALVWFSSAGLTLWLALVSAIALLSSLLVAALGRRNGWSPAKQGAYCVFALLLGPSALALALWLEPLPFRLSCSRCRARISVTLSRCHACGAPAEEPAKEGIEIWQQEPAQE